MEKLAEEWTNTFGWSFPTDEAAKDNGAASQEKVRPEKEKGSRSTKKDEGDDLFDRK